MAIKGMKAMKATKEIKKPPMTAMKAMKAIQKKPAMKAIQQKPAMKAMKVAQKKPAMKAMKGIQKKPAMKAMKVAKKKPAMKEITRAKGEMTRHVEAYSAEGWQEGTTIDVPLTGIQDVCIGWPGSVDHVMSDAMYFSGSRADITVGGSVRDGDDQLKWHTEVFKP